MHRALLYDGLSARGQKGRATCLPDSLDLRLDDGRRERLPLAILSRGASAGDRATLHRDDAPDWRLVLYDPPAEWLRTLRAEGRPQRRAVIAYAAVAASIVVAGIALWFFGTRLLDGVAPLMPHRLMEPIGRAVVEQLGGNRRCAEPDAQAALDRLVARLRPTQGFVEPVQVIVADVPMVNAFAAPGGHIVIFRGLIDQAESSDEVAGVLAHELTHVQLHHPAKALLRQASLSVLIQSVAGDVGHAVDLALMLAGSRDAERAADAGALDLMREARISPSGIAAFFKRMQPRSSPTKKQEGDNALIERLGNFAATHPGGAERVATMEKAETESWPATPAMTERDWQALESICDQVDTEHTPLDQLKIIGK